jgi:hypothetical protein
VPGAIIAAMSIWDIVQQIQIQNLKSRQTSGESEVGRVEGRARAMETQLNDRVSKLVLVTEAMWELLSERTGVTIADLSAKVLEIDARDGAIDRQRRAEILRCPKCNAVVPAGMSACQFCGTAIPTAKADPFQV